MNREKGTAQSYRYACNCVAAFIQEKYKLSDVPFTALNLSLIHIWEAQRPKIPSEEEGRGRSELQNRPRAAIIDRRFEAATVR